MFDLSIIIANRIQKQPGFGMSVRLFWIPELNIISSIDTVSYHSMGIATTIQWGFYDSHKMLW